MLERPLFIVYNAMFLFHVRPQSLNERVVRILPNGGKLRNRKENWRPISLQAVLGKTMDRIHAVRLLAFGIKLRIISALHFGFIRGVGCTDAVVYLLELIAENESNGALTHIALLDYKGAFNTINQSLSFG